MQREPDEPLSAAIGRADRAMYVEKFRRRDGMLEQRTLWEEGLEEG